MTLWSSPNPPRIKPDTSEPTHPLPRHSRNTQVKKCRLVAETVYCVEPFIRPRRLETVLHTTSAIRRLKWPTNITESQSFLELCTAVRRFVSNFAFFVALLNPKLYKGQLAPIRSFNKNELESVYSLKKALISTVVLRISTLLLTRHSSLTLFFVQIGCVQLPQQQNRATTAIGYSSQSLTDAKNKCGTMQRERLAIAWKVLLLRLYLKDKRFTIHTDHLSLKWIRNVTN